LRHVITKLVSAVRHKHSHLQTTSFTVNNRDCKQELLPVSDGNLVDFRYETQALAKQVDPSKKLAELPA